MKSSLKQTAILLANAKLWQILVIFLITLPVSAYFLRQNNLRMIELRNEVVKVDTESGDIKKVAPKIEELRGFILAHMNTSLSAPLELPGSYNTAVEQARKKAEDSGSANGGIYKKAQEVCENPNVALSVRAQCIQDYVTKNAPAGSDVQSLVFPPKELFSYNFASPRWSFDLAGVAVALSITTGLVAIWLIFIQFLWPRIARLANDDPLE